MSKRKLVSWIDSYKELHETTSAPKISCLWASIVALSSALERNVWVFTDGRVLFPNIYVFMVTPPGIGKTTGMINAKELVRGIREEHTVASSSMTHASLVDELRQTARKEIDPKTQKVRERHSLAILSNDLQTLLPAYDTDTLGKLTDLYDGYPYGESRRGGDGKNTFQLKEPIINLYAATTPGHLMGTFSEGAWGLGFMSRTILVFVEERQVKDLFREAPKDMSALYNDLQHDLKLINKMRGELIFTPEAAELTNEWHKTGPYGGPPIPQHPRLINYCTRRTAHLLKLEQISCIQRGDTEGSITAFDFEQALDWLLGAEANSTEIFKEAVDGSDMTLVQDLWAYLMDRQAQQKPTSKSLCTKFLMRRTTTTKAEHILKTTIESKIIAKKKVDGIGWCYYPLDDLE